MLRVASLESEAIASRRVQDAGSWLFATLLASQLYRLASRRRWVRGQGPLLLRPPALQIASLASIALLEAIASLASLASLGLVLRS